jgi:hypothetical protein
MIGTICYVIQIVRLVVVGPEISIGASPLIREIMIAVITIPVVAFGTAAFNFIFHGLPLAKSYFGK